jgi:hypothetical protein
MLKNDKIILQPQTLSPAFTYHRATDNKKPFGQQHGYAGISSPFLYPTK